MLTDLNDLYFFSLVVEKGSFTAASKAVGITKSRISRRVADLEERLGVRLLHRSTRKLTLTEVGHSFYLHCHSMAKEAQAAQEVAEQAQSKPRGRIRVTCPALFPQTFFGDWVIEFMRLYPEVTIVLLATDHYVDLIEEGIDVAFRYQTTPPSDSSLVCKTLVKTKHILVASPEFIKIYGNPTSLDTLKYLNCLTRIKVNHPREFELINQNGEKITVSVQSVLESNDWMILKNAAIAHMGITLIPYELCQEDLRTQKLVHILPQWSSPSASLYVMYPSRRGLIPAVRHFIDFIAGRFKRDANEPS